jgi:hypothetical protein
VGPARSAGPPPRGDGYPQYSRGADRVNSEGQTQHRRLTLEHRDEKARGLAAYSAPNHTGLDQAISSSVWITRT